MLETLMWLAVAIAVAIPIGNVLDKHLNRLASIEHKLDMLLNK